MEKLLCSLIQPNALRSLRNSQADDKQRRAQMTSAKAVAKVENSQADLQMPDAKKRYTPFFTMLKDLTLTGYFTSEIGCDAGA